MKPVLGEYIAQSAAQHRREDEPARGALLPILHDIQAEYGHVSEEAVREIAVLLNLTRAEIHGVVSFYHDFRKQPEERPVLRLCRAEACKARGVEHLVNAAMTVAAGKVSIETVYCLGLCSIGPSAMVGDSVHARLDAERLAALIGAMA
ncbi:MAG: NADH-quinone oxidoreductase subunit E [Sphingomonadales bacterium]|nr:MAG: NADH-quinone oxidoreductase subunit E [Sphingomonadales bacterium]TNF04643.1 MAG: NADH-quinone oxidoreductase subunit E [Sphingomonadales bacterium]